MKSERLFNRIPQLLRPASHQLRSTRVLSRSKSILAAFRNPTVSFRPTLPSLQARRVLVGIQKRYNSTSGPSPVSSVPIYSGESSSADQEIPRPGYELTFTCKPCKHRSTHQVSKQGFHHGTVIIKCPSCQNMHVFADHMKIFSDNSFTIEDLMREKGHLVKKGTLEGDLEFWDDGTQTQRAKG